MKNPIIAIVLVVVAAGCAPMSTGPRLHHPLLGREAGRAPLSSQGALRSPFDDAVPNDSDEEKQVREAIAQAAAASIGKTPITVAGVRYRFDCSGVAAGIYAKAGLPLDDGTGAPSATALYELVRTRGSLRKNNPLPGDLVFFDDTYDSNNNGRRDDPLSHVGVVEKVLPDGTVVFVHRVGASIVRWRLNTTRKKDRHDERGQPLNHYLRRAEGAYPALTTGELFVAYGSLPATSARRLAAR